MWNPSLNLDLLDVFREQKSVIMHIDLINVDLHVKYKISIDHSSLHKLDKSW